jgi:CheY-like chemotaxis protein
MNLPIGFAAGPDGRRRLPSLDRARVSRAGAAGLSVLVVDDEGEVRAEIAELLDRRGLPVLTATTAEAALRVLAGRPDIGALVTDIRLAGMDGLTLAERALAGRRAAEALEVVLITGYVTSRHGIAASRLGAVGLMQKPMRGADITAMVGEALDRAAARRASAAGETLPAPEPGRSPARAAEALLHTLAQRLAGAAELEAAARDLRGPLVALLEAGPVEPAARAEARRLILLIDELLDAMALEAGRLRPALMPVSAHGLLGAVCARLAALDIPCGRRIILQPDADPAWLLDTPRLVRAISLLAERALAGCGGVARGELSVDAGAGGARLELTIRPEMPREAEAEEPMPEALLPLSVARRMLAFQGGRLDTWALPGGGLRLRLVIRGS